jgi:FlaG/FlaF family flagellin (archaellin)
MDSSGSMNSIIYYPRKGLDGIEGTADDGYDPNNEYSGTVYRPVSSLSTPTLMARWRTPEGNADVFQYNEVGTNYTGCYESDGSGSYFGVGSNGTSYFNVGERIMYIDWEEYEWDGDWYWRPKSIAVATIESKDTVGLNTWFKLKDIEGDDIVANSIRGNPPDIHGHFQRPMSEDHLLVDLVLYGFNDNRGTTYQNVRYPSEYLDWVYCHATLDQLDAIRNFFKYGVYVRTADLTQEIIDTPTSYSICDKGSNQRIKQLWTRIQVAREVMCWLAREHNTSVNLGLFDFDPPPAEGGAFDPVGAHLVEGLGDMSDVVSLVDFLGKIWAVPANSWTPLAEALADIWYYFKPGPSKTYWPVSYDLESGKLKPSDKPVSPLEYWCQNNYVVIMTDGESTMDNFDGLKYEGSIFNDSSIPVQRQDGWEDWTHGWGDPDNNDPIPDNYNPDTATYCPNNTCWLTGSEGTDYLDDVAYFLRHQDLFPDRPITDNPGGIYYSDDPVTGWPTDQKIFTYTIGFNINNHLLQQTAINGDGGYYTADSFEELKQAFTNVITSINLRNFAFSSITAPKKTATATNTDLTVSYVGYFMPSQAAPIWEGHLLAFELEDKWGFDEDVPEDQVDPDEYVHDTQEECLNASGGKECIRWVSLSLGHEWDAADKIPINRSLYTHDYGSTNPTDLFEFSLANQALLQPLFGSAVTDLEAQQIINKIRIPQLADVFHSDVGFVGAPPYGKQFISNLNPTGTGDQTYADFYTNNQDRDKVIYSGTNDGIMHIFYADAPPSSGREENSAGQEVWGFIPDAVLPSLTQIVLDSQHTYTVDGRMSANDIYFVKSGDSVNTWSSILVFGLRRGGRSFYCLDITTVGSQPTLLWKFNDPDHSGQSWGKAAIGRIRIQDPNNASQIITQWVSILPGGFEFNSKNPTDTRGKAIFVVDASNGNPIWKVAFTTPVGAQDIPDTSGLLADNSTDGDKFLTTADVFNYPIPSAMLVVDKDNDGFLDNIYFGNIGGHLFKADISDVNTNNWTTQLVFEDKYIPQKGPAKIASISGNELTLDTKPFAVGDGIMGETSYATGYITAVDNKTYTVITTSGTFQVDEFIVSYSYDPIYLAPTAAYDTCYQLWLAFGTGDRDRPRSNFNPLEPYGGRFIIFRDNNTLNFIEDSSGGTASRTLAQFTWSGTDNETLTAPNPIPTDVNGLYFDFPDAGERLFDPEPIIIPDENVIPHIYLNTYQPPPETVDAGDDPCDMPLEGVMKIYDIALKSCGTLEDIEGDRETGRIAGGGIYAGKEYVLYTSKSGDVADVPGGEGGQFAAEPKRLPYPGGLVFWKEKKR